MGHGESQVTCDGGGVFSSPWNSASEGCWLLFFNAQAMLGGLFSGGVMFACLSWRG